MSKLIPFSVVVFGHRKNTGWSNLGDVVQEID